MKQLGVAIGSSGTKCHLYVNDIQFYFSVTSESGEAVKALDWCLNVEVDCLRANEPHMNPRNSGNWQVTSL